VDLPSGRRSIRSGNDDDEDGLMECRTASVKPQSDSFFQVL
jgi:hypothetical protein